MRSSYASLIVVIALFVAQPSLAQWVTQSPIPTDLDVRGVGAPTPTRVFIATEDDSFDDSGALFESNDGGATWVQRDVPFDGFDPLNGIFFLDSQLGWVYGNENYRTTDGGTTWEEMTFLGSTYFMEFYTPSFGYTSTNGGNWISLDGGLTWEVSPDGLIAFDFADDQTGLGVSANGLYRTTDGGASFTLVEGGDADAAAFLSAAVAVGIVDGVFVRSTDGGETWTPGPAVEGRNRLMAVSPTDVLAWGRSGTFPNYDDRLFHSGDGGMTWADLGEVTADGEGVWKVAVPDPQTVVISDRAGNMFHSTDAGLTWTQAFASPGPSPSFLSSAQPVFADAQTGYFGYGSGFVIKTTDGGTTWTQVSSGYGASLNGVGRFEDGRLIAVGNEGTPLTNTGVDGAPWVLHEALTTARLVAVDVLGPESVAAVDHDGRVYRSADAGDTWTVGAATPSGLDAADLDFSTLLDGWVAGSGFSDGAVFHTTDGGDSWTPVSGILGSYVAVDFEGESGWAAGAGEFYRRTIDGGVTWSEVLILPGSTFTNDMDFYNESVGYAVGWFGYAARSEDGGVTWEVLTLPEEYEDDKLWDLHLLGENEFWVSTTEDRAYYSANGGESWTVFEMESGGSGSFYGIAASPDGDAWTVGWEGYIEHFMGPPGPPLNLPPEASFEFSFPGFTVTFTDTSTDLDGTIVSHFWEFGDGATSTEQHPMHTYAEEDTYIVSLTVTDDDGDTGVAVAAVVVQSGTGGSFGDFTEVTPLDPYFFTPQDEDFWVATTAPADYDGDGDLDVAVLGYYVVYNESVEYLLLLFRNEGEAAPDRWGFTYVEVPLGDLTTGASDLAWGDFDGDGDPDLVVGTEAETVLYRNDVGTLVLTDTALPGYYEDNELENFDLRSITWADYDNDGDLDLFLPSVVDPDSLDYRTALMRNDGANGAGGFTFTETDSTFAPTRHAQSAWADADGDEDLDLLLVNMTPLSAGESFIRYYRNEGGGVFSAEDLLGGLVIEQGEAQWGDYDADGDLDILVVGGVRETDQTYHTVFRIYRNDAGTYNPFDVICLSCEGWFSLYAATWADYDNDGDIDILLAGTYDSGSQIERRAKIYANDGGVFTDAGNDLPAPRALGFVGGTFSWFDLDGEGDLDYFIAGEYFVPGGNGLVEVQMHVYRNDAEGQNAAPTATSGLNAVVDNDNDSVLLSWNRADDDSTPAVALTYDLDLYLDEAPVEMPRRLPEPGNVSAVTDWALRGLLHGMYTWSVRAVDSAFNGGPIAQGSFTVGTTTATDPDGIPRVYSFESLYPNPFSASATIRYGLPERADVTVEVYDILGRMVTRLEDEERPAGFHQIEWDGSALASGTYLVRFSTDAFTAARRVTLVR